MDTGTALEFKHPPLALKDAQLEVPLVGSYF